VIARFGQDKPVFAYNMNCVDTVEDRMQVLKQGKRAIADAVLNEGEAALAKLSGNELLALFAGG
jgi:SNF2 family DNA or RNA helicase